MDEDMFRQLRRERLLRDIIWWFEDRWDWWQDNWDAITPWFIAGVGTGILSVTFIV